jgi:predicted amidophosphoribosyltransferase
MSQPELDDPIARGLNEPEMLFCNVCEKEYEQYDKHCEMCEPCGEAELQQSIREGK